MRIEDNCWERLWKTENAAKMIALRITHINGHWEEYGEDFGKKA
jgi:hypothetical protein